MTPVTLERTPRAIQRATSETHTSEGMVGCLFSRVEVLPNLIRAHLFPCYLQAGDTALGLPRNRHSTSYSVPELFAGHIAPCSL